MYVKQDIYFSASYISFWFLASLRRLNKIMKSVKTINLKTN